MSTNTKLAAQWFRRFNKNLAVWTSVAALALQPAIQTLSASAIGAQEQSSLSPNYIQITPENAQIAKQVRLGLDKSIVIDLPADAHDILVANPTVADAVTRTARRLYIFGKEIGQTNIFVFDGTGKQIASLELLIERDIAGLEETIARLLPNSAVRAEMINDNLVLTGSVPTPQAAAKAIQLAQIFVSGGEQSTAGNSSFFSFNDNESQIVNLMKIEGEDQVHLKVVLVEVQRSVVKSLGLNGDFSSGSNNGFEFSIPTGGVPNLASFTGSAQGTLGIGNGGPSLGALYHALERNGVMRTLAEPSLTAISGEEAHFKVGGTYNVPNAIDIDDEGRRTVTYEQINYGIALSFKPVVLTAGRISLKIRTEVSEPTAQAVPQDRSDLNLLSVRHRIADTTVELPSGGSMVIAGLVQDDVRQAITGQPWLMDIPFFGSLFRSREFVREESEVVVIVTPYLVRPTARNKLIQPDENFQPASDAAGYFMGRVNRVYGTKQGNLPKGRYTGSIGFILK